MGNTPPIADERVQKTQDLLKLSKRDIKGFWDVFRRYDREREGVISMDIFFTDICGEPRTLFGDAIFDLIDTEDTQTIEFGEFVQGVCTFAMFQIVDVLRFSFFIFDKDKNGYIDKDELELFVSTLHQGGMGGNVVHALHQIDFNGDGKFDFLEFSALHEKFPTVLYPAFRLQQQMCANVMGNSWWERKKNQLQNDKDAINKEREKKRRIHEKMLYRQRDRDIREKMGLVKYFKGGPYRDYLRRMNPYPQVIVDKDGELQVRYPDPIKKAGDEHWAALEAKEDEDDENDDPNTRRAGASGVPGNE